MKILNYLIEEQKEKTNNIERNNWFNDSKPNANFFLSFSFSVLIFILKWIISLSFPHISSTQNEKAKY